LTSKEDETNLKKAYEMNHREKGKIEPRLKIVGGDFVQFSEIVKRREIFQALDLSKLGNSSSR
jgi:hypothetical protein